MYPTVDCDHRQRSMIRWKKNPGRSRSVEYHEIGSIASGPSNISKNVTEKGTQTEEYYTYYPNESPLRCLEDVDTHTITRSIEDAWLAVDANIMRRITNDKKNIAIQLENQRVRVGWKTVRIFVSSTFEDFQSERDILVKEVFPELRDWCQENQLHLVECDLRWGVPPEASDDVTISVCLEEIDRCKQENILPFFLSMTSERVGWIPERKRDNLSDVLINKYNWIFGLSVTEMEIVHGALGLENPNALFLLRDDSFLESVPEHHKTIFKDHSVDKMAPYKLPILRKKIVSSFPEEQVKTYNCSFLEEDAYGKPVLECRPEFATEIIQFFKRKIAARYPRPTSEETNQTNWEKQRMCHESFFRGRADLVVGRNQTVDEVVDYVKMSGKATPLLLLGDPGMGKSSVMAAAVDQTIRQINDTNTTDRYVFYHFVGAVPDSSDLFGMLCRLLSELNECDSENAPKDLDTATQETYSALKKPFRNKQVIIFVDAVNQFYDDDEASRSLTWLPRELADCVRCVVSTITNSIHHRCIDRVTPSPKNICLKPLNLRAKKDITTGYLKRFGKTIDVHQFVDVMEKKSSENPLWLSLACEDLRIFGLFSFLRDKTAELKDGLEALGLHIVRRLVIESGRVEGPLLMAALCLLQVSPNGILEHELKSILADQKFLDIAYDKVTGGEEMTNVFEDDGTLSAHQWAVVFRGLRAFIRPVGDSVEGRLGFYHVSLSQAVSKAYFNAEGNNIEDLSPENSPLWHQKLAGYFNRSNTLERKAEALPFHLIKLKDIKQLREFLCDWTIFDLLFNKEFSVKLVKYWQECGDVQLAMGCYKEMLDGLDEATRGSEPTLLAKRNLQIACFLLQAGAATKDVKKLALRADLPTCDTDHKISVWNLLADLYYQEVTEDGYFKKEHEPIVEKCVELHEEIIQTLETWNSDLNQKQLMVQRVKLASRKGALADIIEEDDESRAVKLRKEAREGVKTASAFFEKANDKGEQAHACNVLGTMLDGRKEKQLKMYSTAFMLSKQAHGYIHTTTYRILLNTAFCYQRAAKWEKAYDEFKNAYAVAKELYGPTHKRTNLVMEYMEADYIQKIAANRDQELDKEVLGFTQRK